MSTLTLHILLENRLDIQNITTNYYVWYPNLNLKTKLIFFFLFVTRARFLY